MAKTVRTSDYGIETTVRRSTVAQLLALAYLAAGLWYLSWRTLHTVNMDAAYLSVPLLAADFLGYGFFALFAFSVWATVRRSAPAPAPSLTVDVFIPTYNESDTVLRSTILSALAMDYPHRTYVLDDGRRDGVRRLCAEVGAEYLTRSDNRGAKAGNINAALAVTEGEFLAIFDADHAPFQNFLTELLGYFRDPRVALVQAPQAYYNVDSFQHGSAGRRHGKPWHEQSIFYDAIMPGKDRMNAAFWCGSSAIVRREALEGVGGVNTLTVTEDMHTAMVMHANGWETIYHDRELAVGVAPDDLDPFLVQRLRWAQGAMEILRKDNPLRRQGLSVRQRIAYFTSAAYVIEYLPKTVYLLMPPAVLFTGALPMTNMGWNLVFRFLPYYALGLASTQALTMGTNPLFRAERFHLLKIEVMLRALTLLVWPRKLDFKVTPKGASANDHRLAALRHIRAQIIVGIVCAVAAVWGIVSALLHAPWALSGPSLAMTIGWALVNAGMVGALVRSVLVRHHRREVYRFELHVPIEVHAGSRLIRSTTNDVSMTGVGYTSESWQEIGQAVQLVLLPGGPTPAIAVSAVVTSCRKDTDCFRIGAEFTDLTPASQRQLVLLLFHRYAPSSVSDVGPGSADLGKAA